MKTKLLIIVTHWIVLSFIGCNNPKSFELSIQEKEQVRNEVKARFLKFSDDHEHARPEEALSFYAIDDPEFLMAGHGTIKKVSAKEWSDSYLEFVRSNVKWIDVSTPEILVYVLTKNAASLTIEGKHKIIKTNGDTVVVKSVSYTWTMKKFQDGWKAVNGNGYHVYE